MRSAIIVGLVAVALLIPGCLEGVPPDGPRDEVLLCPQDAPRGELLLDFLDLPELGKSYRVRVSALNTGPCEVHYDTPLQIWIEPGDGTVLNIMAGWAGLPVLAPGGMKTIFETTLAPIPEPGDYRLHAKLGKPGWTTSVPFTLPADGRPGLPHNGTLLATYRSGIHDERRLVIAEPSVWAEVWREHATGSGTRPLAPYVDFQRCRVLLASAGDATGHGIRITNLTETPTGLVAEVTTREPGPKALVFMAVIQPIAARLLCDDPRPVTFEERRVVYGDGERPE